jgi:hypothetical protein
MLPRSPETGPLHSPFRRVATALAAASLALGLSASAALAGLAVGTSAPFDPVKIRAVRSQEGVAAAANDSLTLYAWTDFRSGNADIYAARVRHDGTVLDPNGIAVAITGTGETAPAVSWSGSEWLVAWERGGFSIYAARIGTDGEVLDPAGIAIADGPFTDVQPAAAGLGTGHAVVWRSGDLGFSIYGAIIASDGTFDVPPGPLAGNNNHERSPAIAVRDTTAFVAFTSDRNGTLDVYGFRFKRSTSGPPALVRLDANDVAIATGPDRVDDPAVGASANGWLVGWTDGRNVADGNDIYVARVSAGGVVQDPGGNRLSSAAGHETDPAIHHNGNEWLVAFSEQDAGQFFRTVANNGNPTGTRIEVSTASGTLGEAAFGGDPDKPTIAWSDAEIGTSAPKPPQDLLGRLIATDLSLDAPFVIATQTPNQTQPALAFGANRWFVTWVDDRFGPTEGRLRYAVTDSARFEAPGPASIFDVAPRPGLDQQQPTACFDGTNFNLYWVEERGGRRQIFGARYTPGGAFIDSFQVTSGAWDHYEPTCARLTGAVVVLAWTDARLPGDLDIWGQRIVNGALSGVDRPLVQAADRQDERPRLPARTVDPGHLQMPLVFQARTTPGTGEIRLSHVNEDLDLFFNFPFTPGAPRVFEAPQIAWNGENWMITYHEVVENDGPELYIPYAVWLDVGYGGTSGTQPLGPGSYVPANPVVGATGHNFLALWSELAGGDVDLRLRRGSGNEGFVGGPIAYTADAEVDVPGAALQGQGGDKVGFTWLRRQDDSEWDGLRLFGAEAQDSLEGRIVINEFLANPPMGTGEFLELHNVSGETFNLEGWFVVVDGDSSELVLCFSDAPGPGPDGARAKGGDVVLGTQCGEFPDAAYHEDPFDLDGIEGTPEEGKLPNRGAVIELYSPGGVKVDQVAYGFRGGAPVSPPIPVGQLPVARADRTPLETQAVAAPGDSAAISTARLPNGTDTDDDADDFNLTTNSTPNSANTGTEAALGTGLFVTRVFWNPVSGPDAIELYNPGGSTFDFTGWYIGSNDGTQRIGVPDNAWSVLPPLDKRVLRRGELGSFTTDLDYLTVLYLLDPNFQRVEQIGWSRPDNQQPQMCLKREPDTGGFHNGFDWFTSGGEQNLFAGQLRYVTCDIAAPDATTPVEDGPVALAFRGAVPNPVPASGGALVFSVPGLPGGAATHVRLRLIDVAGRARATLVDGPLAPGAHRVPLAGAIGATAGMYYAELDVAGRRLSRPVVVVP